MHVPDSVAPLSRQEAHHAERLLAECVPRHLFGLVNLLRFGVASGGVSGAYAAAAWLLNSARFKSLPQTKNYSRPDGSGFCHCDAEWVAQRAEQGEVSQASLRARFFGGLRAVGAKGQHLHLTEKSAADIASLLAQELEKERPTVLLLSLVLAIHMKRGQLFCCELEDARARLRWVGLEALVKRMKAEGATLELVSLPIDRASTAKQLEVSFRGSQVEYLDSLRGMGLLQGCEGLSVVAYAALHGNTQKDLSSCQVASLSSLAFQKGTRGKIADLVEVVLKDKGGPAGRDTQAALRSLAVQKLSSEKGLEFAFRGLSVEELGQLAQTVGLQVHAVEFFEGAASKTECVEAFRIAARRALGRTIINFSRHDLGQQSGGHHAVVVAYHPTEDMFLIDDPAGFKMPPFWAETKRLVEAMATFDTTKGVERYRGYLVVDAQPGPDEPEMSMSLVLQKRHRQ